MEPSPDGRRSPTGWQPFTFGGVAEFASAPSIWLGALWVLTGVLLGWAVVSYLRTACYPAVELAIAQLPTAPAGIHAGTLQWPTNAVVELANTRLLSLVVNPGSGPVPSQGADVALELTDRALTAQSLFGYWALPYPVGVDLPLNRGELEPLWAAWQPHVRAVLPVGIVLGFLLAWGLVATLVTPVLRLGAALLRREATLAGCWRMALAAVIPAGWTTALGLFLYASRGFHLVDTLVTWLLAHLYLLLLWVGAVVKLPPRLPASPFVPPPATPDAGVEAGEAAPAPVRETERSPFAAPAAGLDPRNPFAGPAIGADALAEPSSEVPPSGEPPEPAAASPPEARRDEGVVRATPALSPPATSSVGEVAPASSAPSTMPRPRPAPDNPAPPPPADEELMNPS